MSSFISLFVVLTVSPLHLTLTWNDFFQPLPLFYCVDCVDCFPPLSIKLVLYRAFPRGQPEGSPMGLIHQATPKAFPTFLTVTFGT